MLWDVWPQCLCSFSLVIRESLIGISWDTMSRERKKKEKATKYPSGLCELSLCWDTPSVLSQAIFNSAWDFACRFSKTYRSASSKSSLLSTRPSLACTRLSRSLITRGSFSKHLVPRVSQPLAFLPRLLACLLFAPVVIHSPPSPCQPQVTAAYSLSNILCIATSPTWESSELAKQRQAPHINPSGNLRQNKTNTGYWE